MVFEVAVNNEIDYTKMISAKDSFEAEDIFYNLAENWEADNNYKLLRYHFEQGMYGIVANYYKD